MNRRGDDKVTLANDESWRSDAHAVLEAYALEVVTLTPITQGLVNLTLKISSRDGRSYALQRLHPVFGPGVNHNLERVTAHLAARGMVTPRLLRTRDDALAVEHNGARWRVLSWIEGQAFDFLAQPAQAAQAGALLARFHGVLADFTEDLIIERAPIHEFARHRARLAGAQDVGRAHRLGDDVSRAVEQLDAMRAACAAPPATPARLVHGDPKISNVLFDKTASQALCLVDLDTLARMALPLELGDALRSWCNPRREDDQQAHFEMVLFSAAVGAYGAIARHFISTDEVAAIVPATVEIYLELAARFLIDTLEESYFGWDARRYDSRGAHNLARARGQLTAASSLMAQHVAAEEVVISAFG
jgi:Ser/Thr protein kinase RdoA (MazF antagonist)